MLGPIVGAFFMIVIPELLRVAREIEPVYTGIILILVVIFLPNGLISLIIKGPQKGDLSRVLSRLCRRIKGDVPVDPKPQG